MPPPARIPKGDLGRDASQEEREAMTDQELQRLEYDALDELGGV
jgi:hypothetical protein